MPRALAALALAAFLAGSSACGAQSRQHRPGIRILEATVVGSDVVLRVKVTGWTMATPHAGVTPKPRTGQWQIFADDRYAGFSDQPTYGTISGLAVGTYTIWVALARTDYSLVYPLIRSQPVTVRVHDDRMFTAQMQ